MSKISLSEIALVNPPISRVSILIPVLISIPKSLSLFAGTVLEFISQISRKRNGFSVETAHSSYKNIVYDKSKLMQAIPIQFYTLEETIDNAIRGQLR